MARSLRSRMIRGASAQVLAQGVTTAIRLSEVPLFLYAWGAALYGEWLILSAFPAYLAMSGMGFPSAAARDMAMKVAAGERTAALEAFQSIAVLVLGLSTALAAAFLALVFVIPFESGLNIVRIDQGQIFGVLLCLSALIVIGQFDQVIFSALYCEGRYAEGTVLLTAIRGLEYLGLATLVLLGENPMTAATGMLAGHVIGTVVMFLVVRRSVPWARLGLSHASFHTIRRLFTPAIATMAFPIGRACNHQGFRLVVGMILGPAAVTLFTATRIMARLVPQLVYSLTHIFQPEMGVALGKNDSSLLRRLNRRCMQVTLWVSATTSVLVWLLSETLIRLWTGGQLDYVPLLVALLLIAGFVESLWQSLASVLFAANRHSRIAVVFLVTNCVILAASYVMTDALALPGAAIALIAAEIAMLVCVLPASLSLTDDRGGAWLRSVTPPPLFILREARRALSRT